MKRAWFGDDGPWWGPYLGVLVLAAGALLAGLLFVLLHGPELLRSLRTTGL